jgi:aldehyde dehydrogenase (NAD+)
VAAVAAGCPVILKPSEKAPHSAEVLEAILSEAVSAEKVCVCRGGPEIASGLLELPFRHIYFTGGPGTGRKVMAAAAKHLASVTLELGGKSPAIVDKSANLVKAARKVVWGKFSNAGQTCVAPDYVLVHESIREQFERTLAEMTVALYGGSDRASDGDMEYCRIVSKEHAAHLAELLDDAVSLGAVPLTGGDYDIPERFVAPTVLSGVTLEFRLMREEIFGPILPVLGYRTEDELHTIVARHPFPLTAYIFARDRAFIERTLHRLQAGSCVVNETLLQFANARLPFGGVGRSGMGRGHGRAGFLAFSNEKAVFRRWTNSWLLRRIQPPYTKRTIAWLRALIRMT